MYANTLRSTAAGSRPWRLGASALGTIVALTVSLTAASQARAQEPQFQNGDGITVVSQSQTGREIDLTVNTTDVQGQHKIIVLLPEGYDAASEGISNRGIYLGRRVIIGGRSESDTDDVRGV